MADPQRATDGEERVWERTMHKPLSMVKNLMAHVPRIYWPDAIASEQTILLDSARAHHLLRVLKRKTGDALILFQPGVEFDAHIVATGKNQLDIEVTGQRAVHTESPLNTVLIQSLSRGDKMDFTIQKAVELGISSIVPVTSARGGVQLDGKRLAKKQAHWQAVAHSAAEQSGRTRIPTVMACEKLDNFLSQHAPLQGFVLDPLAAALPTHAIQTDHAIHILIGPEGGLSDTEIQLAQRSGLTPAALGPRVLRTETAGLVALSALQIRWGDL